MKKNEKVITPIDPRFLSILDSYSDPHRPTDELAISNNCNFLYDTYCSMKKPLRIAILARALRIALLEKE